ncbi:MAG: PsbP-related protein [Candidatus Paceibacterota bacterium]|jgi:hypothetical protein
MNKNQKGVSNILVIGLVILALIIAGGIGYYFLSQEKESLNQNKENLIDINSADAGEWNTYTDKEHGFEIKYPNSWTFSELLVNNSENIFSINFYEEKDNEKSVRVSISKADQSIYDFALRAKKVTKTKKLLIDSYPAVLLGKEGALGGSLNIFSDGKIFKIDCHEEALNEWQNMFPTFKLIKENGEEKTGNMIDNLKNDEEARKFFDATEIVENKPDSIEFWTEAECPSIYADYPYEAPLFYYVNSCEKGEIGSHGGCLNCLMSEITVKPWQIYKNSEIGFEFRYPLKIFSVVDEPQISAYKCDFSSVSNDCNGFVNGEKKEIVKINGKTYCLTGFSDSAMGTNRLKYEYVTGVKDECIKIKFTLSQNCSMFAPGDPKGESCQQERPQLLQEIISTFKFIQ